VTSGLQNTSGRGLVLADRAAEDGPAADVAPGGPARLHVAAGGAAGVSARTVRRRLSSVSGLYGFLHARGNVTANPVPRGLPTRRERQRPRQGVPLGPDDPDRDWQCPAATLWPRRVMRDDGWMFAYYHR
jgi:hypothetical protein